MIMLRMTTWADIQRLASDLQRVQLSQSAKKLSEANCVEVVTKLISKKLIDVVFTRDGHSYVTKSHLATEVRNECLANGGRCPLTDIATSLNLDFDHVDRIVRNIVQEDENYVLSNGELFASEYVDKLMADLRSLLLETGCRSTGYLCKYWELSQELLNSLLLSKLTDDFDGVLEGDVIYTKEYLDQHKYILRAVLLGSTKSTLISNVQTRVSLPPKRFWAAFDELVAANEIPGRLNGSRTSPSCVYVPHMFDNLVRLCVQNAYRQNEFIQLAMLKKLGLADNKASIHETLGDSKLVALPTMFVSQNFLDHMLTAIAESITASGFTDAQVSLQSIAVPLDISDIDFLCLAAVKKDKNLQTSNGFVFSNEYISKVLQSLENSIEKKAHNELDRMEKEKKNQKASVAAPKKVDEEDDWGDSKKGGKKKGGRATASKTKKFTPEGEGNELTATLSSEDLDLWLVEEAKVPEEILEVVSEVVLPKASDRLRSRVLELSATQQSSEAASQKKKLVAIQSKAQSLYDSLCSFEDSASSFSESLSCDLKVHTVRSIGGELATAVLSFASGLEQASLLTDKQREQTIAALPSGSREVVVALFDAVKNGEFDAVHDAIDQIAGKGGCSLHLRTPDNKTKAASAQSYVEELSTVLTDQSEPASSLLSCILLILAKKGKPIVATGKFVARLVPDVEDLVSQSCHELIVSCQKDVVHCIKNKDDDVAKDLLRANITKLKELVLAL